MILSFATFVGLKNRKRIFGAKVRKMPPTYQKGFQIGKKLINVLQSIRKPLVTAMQLHISYLFPNAKMLAR